MVLLSEPILVSAVDHILSVSCKKQVVWCYTRRLVALMTNLIAIWYWPNEKLIRNNVSLSLDSAFNGYAAISAILLVAVPYQTAAIIKIDVA